MALIDKIFSGSWIDSDIKLTNVGGTAVTSAVADPNGEAIADTYTLTISSRTGGTCTVTVSTASSNNPYNGDVHTSVPCDSTTNIHNIVPGAVLVFNSAAANGNTSTVKLGLPQGSFDASGVDAGIPTSGLRHQVENTGADAVSLVTVKLLTQVVLVQKVNAPIAYVTPFADNATEKIAGGGSNRTMPYLLSLSSVSGSGLTRIATLSLDGVAVGSILKDLTTGSTVNGTGIKALGNYPYQFLSGPLQDVVFALSATVANSDSANVLIFPSRYVQIAEDLSGVEGLYGTADVTLTETGQASGTITASGVAYYWTRFLIPSGSNNQSNPYPCDLAISASSSSGAGWGE